MNKLLSQIHLPEFVKDEEQRRQLVAATGKRNNTKMKFSASETTNRLLHVALRKGLSDEPFTAESDCRFARTIMSTAHFHLGKL